MTASNQQQVATAISLWNFLWPRLTQNKYIFFIYYNDDWVLIVWRGVTAASKVSANWCVFIMIITQIVVIDRFCLSSLPRSGYGASLHNMSLLFPHTIDFFIHAQIGTTFYLSRIHRATWLLLLLLLLPAVELSCLLCLRYKKKRRKLYCIVACAFFLPCTAWKHKEKRQNNGKSCQYLRRKAYGHFGCRWIQHNSRLNTRIHETMNVIQFKEWNDMYNCSSIIMTDGEKNASLKIDFFSGQKM